MTNDDWMHEQEQGVMATEETYRQGDDREPNLTRLEKVLLIANVIVSLSLGGLGATRLLYGTFDPAITVVNIALLPPAILLAVVFAVVWMLLFAAGTDYVNSAVQWAVSLGEREG